MHRRCLPPQQPGIWAVARHADIAYVSKHPELFTSGQGVMVEEVPEEMLEAAMSFLAMDGKRHSLLRRLVSAAFTPRRVAAITPSGTPTRSWSKIAASASCAVGQIRSAMIAPTARLLRWLSPRSPCASRPT